MCMQLCTKTHTHKQMNKKETTEKKMQRCLFPSPLSITQLQLHSIQAWETHWEEYPLEALLRKHPLSPGLSSFTLSHYYNSQDLLQLIITELKNNVIVPLYWSKWFIWGLIFEQKTVSFPCFLVLSFSHYELLLLIM